MECFSYGVSLTFANLYIISLSQNLSIVEFFCVLHKSKKYRMEGDVVIYKFKGNRDLMALMNES